jgi:hypothetical protein
VELRSRIGIHAQKDLLARALDTVRSAALEVPMTRAEHAAFIKGLEAARRITQAEQRGFSNSAIRIACDFLEARLTTRIRRERAKMKETKG